MPMTNVTATSVAAGDRRAAVAAGGAPRPIWHPWAGRGWPCTASEESQLLADLRAVAGADASSSSDSPTRRSSTALVTALRCGVGADELLARAPGLLPVALLAAHRDLDHRRRVAVAAWEALVGDASADALARHADAAAPLLAVLVGRLRRVAAQGGDLHRAATEAAADVARTAGHVALIEAVLERRLPGSAEASALGARLLDADGTGAWAAATYLPTRVGTLVPLRVAALRLGASGERVPRPR
jgi:hypothetical protein